MKSVLLNGVEIKVGSMVRFLSDADIEKDNIIDDKDRNIWQSVNNKLNLPILYGYYIVRGFSTGGFLLEGVINQSQYTSKYVIEEPGFAFNRFIAIPEKAKVNYKVNFKIAKEVIESLDLKSIKVN